MYSLIPRCDSLAVPPSLPPTIIPLSDSGKGKKSSPFSSRSYIHSILMASTPSFLLRILLLVLLSHPSQQQQSSSLSPSDKAALFDIRSNLRDLPSSNFFTTWNFASDPCVTFAGVICSRDDEHGTQFLRVSSLTLGTGLADSPGLTGTLSPSLSNLTALNELVIYGGRISGLIPSDFGARIRGLRLVSISNNLISGPIPVSLASLPDLHTLDLGHNKLQGPIPPLLLLPSSPSLKVLVLAANGGLAGELPPGISAAQLLHLDLRDNSLSGALPQLPSTLRYFSASGNALSGPLDAAFAAPLPDLAFLDLSMNAFTGPVPQELFSLPNLSSLLLERNNLSGPLAVPPPHKEAPPSWVVVDLSHNMLTGEVPPALAAAGSLYLNNNQLTGAVPEEVVRSVYVGNMTTLYAQHNYLTSFPAPPLPLPDSVALCLSYNCMSLPSAAAGCPASAGTLPSRPPYQCSNTAAAAGGES